MSVTVTDILRASRPTGPPGRADKYLPEIAQELRRVLEKSQLGFPDHSVVWPHETLGHLAAVLVEFGEDLHSDAGLWRSLESYNREFFDTPFPLAADTDLAAAPTRFDPRRIQHLLWTLWKKADPEGCPGPTHPNLLRLAGTAGTFLAERFARLPADSGVRAFLAGPSQFGWDIKRKLVWLGTKSYLFRQFFAHYVSGHEEGATVGVTDDFICQETTGWSGLGVIDILASALDVSAEDRATLRSWYERHAAFYRVLTRKDRGGETELLTVRNLINGQAYTVRVHMPRCPFQPGLVVFGSLTPWRGEWYWSGEQRTCGNVPEHEEAGLRKEMLERHPGIAYRYCPAEAAQAREANRKQHEKFVAHYGADLVVYPDGLALAAAEQKRLESLWRAADPEHVRRVMCERGPDQPRPPMRLSREFLDHDQGIGAFYNPDEGVEFMLGFHHVLSGLRKQGEALSDKERDALRHLVSDRAISPALVHRLVREHGAASVLETFHLRDLPPERALAFLLRCQKGQFHRKRYPSLSLVQSGGT
ncbi:MAG: DUF3843 family protein [Verrucomicrobiales bacterium]|nr:DUF3843 family protein [Verrucomicrobiales bacterium]